MSTLRTRLTRTRLLGRDPVMAVSLVVSGLVAALPLLGWSGERASLVAAALVAVGGAVAAWLVSVDRMLPLLTGAAKAILAAVAGFGLHLPDNQVAAFMAILTLLVGLFGVRPQVSAEQPPFDAYGNIDQRELTIPPNTHLFAEEDETSPHTPLPPVPDDTQRADDTVTWSRHEPATEYLPRTQHEQPQQYRTGETTGRHHANWWPEGSGSLETDLGT